MIGTFLFVGFPWILEGALRCTGRLVLVCAALEAAVAAFFLCGTGVVVFASLVALGKVRVATFPFVFANFAFAIWRGPKWLRRHAL